MGTGMRMEMEMGMSIRDGDGDGKRRGDVMMELGMLVMGIVPPQEFPTFESPQEVRIVGTNLSMMDL